MICPYAISVGITVVLNTGVEILGTENRIIAPP